MDVTIKGFDGQIIDRTYGAYRVQNNAIKELFGKTKISFEDMLTIYDVLYEKGYDGDYPLTDYYKNYYQDVYKRQIMCFMPEASSIRTGM